jgi:LPS-assembly protein
VRLSADVDFVSSRDYYSDFGEDYEIYTRDKAETVVYLSRNWEKLNLSGQVKYLKDLEQKSDFTLQRLPEVRLAALPRRIDQTPLFLQVDLTADTFWRRTGEKGERLMVRPALSTDILSNRWLELVPEIGFRERMYQTGSGFEQKGIYDLGARASTQVARVYRFAGTNVRRVRHNVEPELTYLFLPRIDQDDLPAFDGFDRIDAVNRLGFALTNRFTARLEPENEDRYYHEFLYLRLSESYDFRAEDRVLDPAAEGSNPLSPLLLEMIVRPNRWSYLDLDTSYDLNSGENRLVEFNLRGTLTDRAGNDFGIDYRNRRGELEYMAANLATSLVKPVYLNLLSRFDFKAGKALENVIGFEYRARCWSLLLNFRERPEDRELMISFALSGLGRVAGFNTTRPRNE